MTSSIPSETDYVAFQADRLIASGSLPDVANAVLDAYEKDPSLVLVFDAVSSRPVDIDLRGSREDVMRHVAYLTNPASTRKKRGRPKLGVVSKEVTLLPRHWAWLASQRGGASVTLRRLVDEARRASVEGDRQRHAQEATYRFINAMAGNRPGFEDATRFLYRGNRRSFEEQLTAWPEDIREHALKLASAAFDTAE